MGVARSLTHIRSDSNRPSSHKGCPKPELADHSENSPPTFHSSGCAILPQGRLSRKLGFHLEIRDGSERGPHSSPSRFLQGLDVHSGLPLPKCGKIPAFRKPQIKLAKMGCSRW